MTLNTNTTDRKALVKALSTELGTEATYMGPPTFAYQIGAYTVDREGNISGEDFEARRLSCRGTASCLRMKRPRRRNRRSRKRKRLIQERSIR